MKNNRTLISENFDLKTQERNRQVYIGKLLSISDDLLEHSYAFKIEDYILRMNIKFSKSKCEVIQNFPDSKSKITLTINQKELYEMTLNNGYVLNFVTEANLIQNDLNGVKLKYYLFDKNTKEVISLNEITIIGENDVC